MFAVEVDASDDNGVQTVQCRVASDDGAAVPTLTLRADRERPTRARFVGEVTLPVAWAKRSVQLVCLATDAYGNACLLYTSPSPRD